MNIYLKYRKKNKFQKLRSGSALILITLLLVNQLCRIRQQRARWWKDHISESEKIPFLLEFVWSEFKNQDVKISKKKIKKKKRLAGIWRVFIEFELSTTWIPKPSDSLWLCLIIFLFFAFKNKKLEVFLLFCFQNF